MIHFIKDLGMHYQTPSSQRKERIYLVMCDNCNKQYKMQARQYKAGYTEYCKDCNLKRKKK